MHMVDALNRIKLDQGVQGGHKNRVDAQGGCTRWKKGWMHKWGGCTKISLNMIKLDRP